MDPSLHVRMTERSHPSQLPPRFKKSRSRIVEREKKKSKNSRSSRSLFKSRTFSGASSHCALLVSHSVISLPNIFFFCLTSLYFHECGFCLERRKEIDFFSLFSSLFFRGRCLASFCLQSRKFPSLSLSLSHSLTLFRLVNTQIHEKKFKKKRWWSFRREFILFF